MKATFKILCLLFAIIFWGYILFHFHDYTAQSPCKNIEIVISDSAKSTLLRPAEIEHILRKKNLIPTGRNLKEAQISNIEKSLSKETFIQDVQCFITSEDKLRIAVKQKLPLLRIFADNGDNYYLDEKGIVNFPHTYEADLPVVTGTITKNFAQRELIKLGVFLRNNDFWGEQVVQLHVNDKQEVDMVLRISDQLVELGRIEHLDRKFRYLKAFYKKVLPQVGWSKYKKISVAYDKQVVATRNDFPPKDTTP